MLSTLENTGGSGETCPSSKMKNLETASQLEVWEYSLTVPHLINWSRGLSDQRIVVKSTICTHWIEYRGRGLASAVVREMSRRIQDKGEVPFCYVVAGNSASPALFKRLGFVQEEEKLFCFLQTDSK